MDNYYQDLLTKINNALINENYTECRQMIDEELRMPYVPLAIEDKLKMIRSQLPIDENITKKSISDFDQIGKLLKGSVAQQVQAIEYLNDLNIRQYLSLVKDYLADTSNNEIIKSYLLMILIKQQLTEEIVINKNGFVYTIIPASLEIPEQSEGYRDASLRLNDLLASEDPSLLNLALDVLYQMIYLKLPESYEVDEVEDLVFSIIRYVLVAMNDRQRWNNMMEDHHIDDKRLMDINL
ncbi:MAG: DUF3196 family protein [Erysipelotrichaceae bacterium]|nr:DUF3196 family protein [Erysipelotrichaceae bacterium]MDD4642719.1 DUF3196 family protein [Erysipelotrichaceae bacterium]